MEKILLIFWLLLLPTQLSKFVWPDWSVVAGIRVDYLAWVIYFADIVWLVWWLGFGRKFRLSKWFWILMIVNLFGSLRWEVSLFRWWRWFMLLLLAKRWLFDLDDLARILDKLIPCWFSCEFLLSLAQVANGSSLQGIFYWFGERKFSYIEPGVAIMKIFGETLVRAYGTFSHPNSMAGFAALCLIWWWNRYKKTKFWWLVNWLGMALIIMAGSRLVWVYMVLAGFVWANRYRKGKAILAVIMLLFAWISGFGKIGWDVDGWSKRVELLNASWIVINKYWILGVGLGNNIVAGAAGVWIKNKYWLQPVHNLLFLVASEIGTVGLITIFWQVFKKAKNVRWDKWKIVALGLIVVTGTFDHYWLTLPQNMGLLAIMMTLIYGKRDNT